MNFQTMHKQRKVILLASALGVIAAFLPWQTISAGIFGASVSEGVNGFHGIAVVAFLAFIAAGILAITGQQANRLERSPWLGALGAGVIALICAVIAAFNTSGGSFGFVEVGIGIGCWISMAAALGVAGAAWFLKAPEDNLKAGLDSVKKTIASATAAPATTAATTVVPNANTTPPPDRIAELEKLVQLKNDGHLTEEEYQQMKAKILLKSQ